MKTMAEALAHPGTVRWNEVFPHGNWCGAFFHVLRGCPLKGYEVNEEICATCEDFVPLMDDVGRSMAWKKFISKGGQNHEAASSNSKMPCR